MPCCVPHLCVPCHESVKGYKSGPGVDHWTAVGIILSNQRTKEMFLDYGGDKEFVVNSYVDAS